MKRKLSLFVLIAGVTMIMLTGTAFALPTASDDVVDPGEYRTEIQGFEPLPVHYMEVNGSGGFGLQIGTQQVTNSVSNESVTLTTRDQFYALNESNLSSGVVVYDSSGTQLDSNDYEMNLTDGSIKALSTGSITSSETIDVTYDYYESELQEGDQVNVTYDYQVTQQIATTTKLQASNNTLRLNVSSTDNSTQLIPITISKDVLNVSNAGDIEVLFDNGSVTLASNLTDITEVDSEDPDQLYWVTNVTENSSQVLVRNSNWSTHTIEISEVEATTTGAIGDSIPILVGYLPIGLAFGVLASDAGI